MMSYEDMRNMPQEEWRDHNPFEKKSCDTCNNLFLALSYWCGSEKAKKARGTRVPGCCFCPYWKPNWREIPKQYKTKENGYVSLLNKFFNWIDKEGFK